MSRDNVAPPVWLTNKPVPSRPTRPLVNRLAFMFPPAGRVMVALVIHLPQGRLRRSLIEWAAREPVIGSFNRRDFDEVRPFFSPDFEATPADHMAAVVGLLPGERLHGYDAFRRFLEDWVDIWGEFSIEPKQVVDLGSSFLLLNHMRGHGTGSGINIDGQEEAQLYVFKSGRWVEYRQFWGWQEALEAAGLSE